MARSISILRRRAGLIDLGIRVRSDVSKYKFARSANFDGTFTQFAEVPAHGLRSETVADVLIGGSHKGLTRFVFDPADYSLSDDVPHWIKITPVDLAGVDGPQEVAHLIPTYDPTPNRTMVIAGEAPAGASLSNSMELQLPGLCNDMLIAVDGTTPMYIAFESGGPEFRVPTVPNEFITISSLVSTFHQVFIRGAGLQTTFSMKFALKNNLV